MRHKIAGKKLSRNLSLRKATLRDLAKATLIRQSICTTRAKAKEARKLVDRLITLGKKDTLDARRQAFSILCDHSVVSDLFRKTSPRFKNRIGGYTRIIPLRYRRGDNADLALLELTEKEIIVTAPPKAKKSKGKLEAPKTAAVKDVEAHVKSEKVEEVPRPTKEPLKKGFLSQKDQDQGKIKKTSFMGGLRKIFQRKAPGQ